MEPVRDLDYKLVDVLNALLDTGVVINADVIITVSGIPLIGINLRAALAGMATMLDYGLMEPWDESIRRHYAKEMEERGRSVVEGNTKNIVSNPTEFIPFTNKKVIQKEGLWYLSSASDIIGETWLPGYMYVTSEKVYWTHQTNGKVLFDAPIDSITCAVADESNIFIPRKRKNKILELTYKDANGKTTALFSGEEIKIRRAKSVIENVNNTLLNHI